MAYVEELAKALKDDDPLTRERVANALKELEDPRATMPLVEALGDPCGDVRRAAARALSWIGDERARPAFIKALQEGDFSLRFWAVIGLQKVGNEGAVKVLLGALKDPDEGVRLQAVYALAGIGDRRAVDPLIRALHDEDAHVRMVADSNLREAFKIKYDPDTGQTENIAEKDEGDIDTLPPEEREKIDGQLQIILRIIKEMEEKSGICRDDLLYDALYEDHGIRRKQVARFIAILMKKGSIHTPNPGYYAMA